eukprot:g2342.t1
MTLTWKLLFLIVLFYSVSKNDERFAEACELTLHVNGSTSLFEFAGLANNSLIPNLLLQPQFPNQQAGLLGSFIFTIPGACPASNRQLQRSLNAQNFTLASNDLELYPGNITLQAGAFATLHFIDLSFLFETMELRVSTETNNAITSPTELQVRTGSVEYIVAPALGLDPGNASLVDEVAQQELNGLIYIEGSRMHLEFPSVLFQFETEFETGLEIAPNITSTLNLTGQIFAEAYVECSEIDCGAHGRCLALDSGESVCQCNCGWTGEACEIPSGFCGDYGVVLQSTFQAEETNTASIVPTPSPVSVTNLEQQCEELFTSRTCQDSRQEYSINEQDCVCIDGWNGTSCDLCQNNAACAEFHNQDAPCVRGGIYETYSGLKAYECNMQNTGYDIFIGNFLTFLCNTTGPRFYDEEFQQAWNEDSSSMSVIQNTPFCTVNFDYQQNTPVNCTAWGCFFEAGSATVECSEMICDCEDCDAIRTVVDSISSVELECDGNERCEVRFGGLSLTVSAPCVVRECLLPSNPDFSSLRRNDDGFEVNWDIFTISLPLVFLGILVLFFGVPSWRLSCKIRMGKILGKDERSQKKQFVESTELSFRNVSCLVPSQAPTASLMDKLLNGRHISPPDNHHRNLTGLHQDLLKKTETRLGFKSVLHGLSGTFKPGELVGVMGPSGGGKTTFLTIISAISVENLQQRKIQGEILINGKKAGRWIKHFVAFVPQDDKLMATLTVRECLIYSAILRKPGSSMDSIHRKVNGALSELGLLSVEHSLIGGSRNHRGISGGERRRVTIDEPTSGLDSFTALNLISNLNTICQGGGRTVILSVHQPAPAMLELLDQVLLLSKGFQVYLGPPRKANEFFSSHGLPCPHNLHIAEFMLETVSNPQTLVSLLNSIHYHSTTSNQSPTEPEASSGSEANSSTDSSNETVTRNQVPRQSPYKTVQVLLWRGFIDIVRNPALLRAHVAIALLIGFLCGVIFFDAALDIEGAQNRLGAAFFVLAFLGFWSLTIIDLLHAERSIVLRETTGGYYNPFLYLLSKIILDAVVLRILPSILLSVPLYFLMGLQNTAEKFVIFLFTVCTFNVTVGALAMTITILSPTAGTASLLINTILLIGLLFAGHLVNVPSMHRAVRWIHYLSPFNYGFQVLAVNELLGLRLRFEVPGYTTVDGVGGDVFLRTVGLESEDISGDLRSLVVAYAIALFLTFFALWFTMMNSRIRYRSIFKRLWN